MRHLRWNTKRVAIAIGIACLLLIATVGIASKRRAVSTPGSEDAVVARVNGSPIYRSAIVSAAQNIATNLSVAADSVDVRSEALRHLVKQEILYQTASRYGFNISDDELTSQINQNLDTVLASDDEAVRRQFLTYLERAGIPPEQYPTDSAVLEVHRRTYMIGRMRQSIIDRVPLEQRTSAQAL